MLELVRTTTSDGLRLDGSLRLANENARRATGVDALILLHGVGGTFYGGSLFDALVPPILDLGIAALRVNTRGHGAVSMIASDGGPSRQGAAYEVVDQCRYDVAAWVELLRARGFSRIGLLGHSLGAIKALYCEAHESPADVTCVIAASPPRLSYAAFQNSPRSSDFFESLETARQHVAAGQPEELFTARFPFPLLISAASYIDKYGPEERYNILKFIDLVAAPTLVTYGDIELETGGVAFAGMPEAIGLQKTSSQRVDVATIPGADHFYTGVYDRLADVIVSWLASTLATT